jgi:hypothetical protein
VDTKVNRLNFLNRRNKMTFLKQWATMDNGGGVVTTRLIPATEPTGAAYVAWKAKNYTTTLQHSALNTTQTGYRCKYDFHQMWRYHKILQHEGKLNAVNMAA